MRKYTYMIIIIIVTVNDAYDYDDDIVVFPISFEKNVFKSVNENETVKLFKDYKHEYMLDYSLLKTA